MILPNSLESELRSILTNLVQIPSENPPGITKNVVDYLISEVFKEEEGYNNEIITHIKNNIKLHNLVSKVGTGKKKIILAGHLDVVPAGDVSKWTYPPYSAHILSGKLYGRGSADMKGGLTSLIGVIKSLTTNKEFLEDYELIFLGTADEEAGMTGAVTLKEKGIMDNVSLLTIAEPTNLNIGIAEKGLLWVTLKVSGKAAHGSTPEEGINAIEGSLHVIPKLYGCLIDKKNPLLGQSTLNIGKIKGGTKINVVPDYAELELDFRLIPEHNPEYVIDKLREIKYDPYIIDFEITNRLPALQTDLNHPFIKNLKRISNKEIIGLPYATDAARLIDLDNPVPFVIFGPGNPQNVHTSNESIKLDQVFLATNYLTRCLLDLDLN